MFEAEKLIPRGDPDGDMAESDVWGTIGVALIQLNDLEGAADAFQKADFVWADKAYPRPDFDDVYNMAVLAAQLGRGRSRPRPRRRPPPPRRALGPSAPRRMGQIPLRHGRRAVRRAEGRHRLPARASTRS